MLVSKTILKEEWSNKFVINNTLSNIGLKMRAKEMRNASLYVFRQKQGKYYLNVRMRGHTIQLSYSHSYHLCVKDNGVVEKRNSHHNSSQ